MEQKNKGPKYLHIINVIIVILLIIISFSSIFFISRAEIPTKVNSEISLLFRGLISMLILIFSFIFFLMGAIFPSKPYFLDEDQKRNIKRAANVGIGMVWLNALSKFVNKKGDFGTLIKAGAQTSIISNAKDIKFIRRIWAWYFAFMVFVFAFCLTWFLFAFESGIEEFSLLGPFINNATINTYNILISICLLLLILLTITSIMWRILIDKLYKDDKYWQKEPFLYIIFAFVYFIIMIMLSMYFQLDYLGMFILVGSSMIIISLVENGLFKKSYIIDESSPKKKENKILNEFFEDKTITKDIEYYYHFERFDKQEKRLENFGQLKGQFEKLKMVFDNNDNQREIELYVIAKPNINGIDRISTTHQYNKNNETIVFLIEIHEVKLDGEEIIYLYDTTNINELINIYYEFIQNKNLPDLSRLKKITNNK